VDSTVTLWLLGASGVLSIALFVVKGLLDQLPDVFASLHAARRAWHEALGRGAVEHQTTVEGAALSDVDRSNDLMAGK
jgi:hypothetical protein